MCYFIMGKNKDDLLNKNSVREFPGGLLSLPGPSSIPGGELRSSARRWGRWGPPVAMPCTPPRHAQCHAPPGPLPRPRPPGLRLLSQLQAGVCGVCAAVQTKFVACADLVPVSSTRRPPAGRAQRPLGNIAPDSLLPWVNLLASLGLLSQTCELPLDLHT